MKTSARRASNRRPAPTSAPPDQPASALRRPSQASPSVLPGRCQASDQEPPPRAVPYCSISVACLIHCHRADLPANRKLYLCCPSSITRPIACRRERPHSSHSIRTHIWPWPNQRSHTALSARLSLSATRARVNQVYVYEPANTLPSTHADYL